MFLPLSFFNTWQHNQSGSLQTLKTPPAILNGRVLYYLYQCVSLVCKCAHVKGKKNTGVSVEMSVTIIDITYTFIPLFLELILAYYNSKMALSIKTSLTLQLTCNSAISERLSYILFG